MSKEFSRIELRNQDGTELGAFECAGKPCSTKPRSPHIKSNRTIKFLPTLILCLSVGSNGARLPFGQLWKHDPAPINLLIGTCFLFHLK